MSPQNFLGYAMPLHRTGSIIPILETEDFQLFGQPLSSPESFLEYDGVVVFAGAFETVKVHVGGPQFISLAPADLDMRVREFVTAFQRGKTLIFLVPQLPFPDLAANSDLFRRVAPQLGLNLAARNPPCAVVESLVPEFREFVSRFGSGYVDLSYTETKLSIVPICSGSGKLYGVVISGSVFVLPCTAPQLPAQVTQMVTLAIEGALAYRARISKLLPDWANEFSFEKEAQLRKQANELHEKLAGVSAKIETYLDHKTALCCQSTPLVEAVASIFRHFFDLPILIDDKCVEDGTLVVDGEIVAVFEIKGVKGNFAGANINQVDSHRERLDLTLDVPGILIMNTMMSATSLAEKEERPHPDTIKKAVRDNVLLIRTLDLLRYADCIERGLLTREEFRETLLTKNVSSNCMND